MFRENKTHDQTELFLAGNLIPDRLKKRLEGHWSTLFYKKVFCVIDERIFIPIYSNTGIPNFPANILAGLEILKEIHNLSDEQLYDRYHFDYIYQRALGVEDLEKHSFAIRTLYHFRERLADYEIRTGENLMMEVFRSGRDKIIEELGIRTGIQRTDSVLIQANIKRMNRLSLFHKLFSNVVLELQKKKVSLSPKYTDIVKEDGDGFTYRLPRENVPEMLENIGRVALTEKLKPKYLSGRILFRGLLRVRKRMILRTTGINFRRYYLLMLLFFQILLFEDARFVKLRFSGAN